MSTDHQTPPAPTSGKQSRSSPASGSASGSFVRMFKPQFAPLVEAGSKRQTVRPTPKRMPKPGDRISLRCWSGAPYRSKQRVLREAEITEVHDVRIDAHGVCLYEQRSGAGWAPDREAFAKADGFRSWDQMRAWFEETHALPFVGVVLYWQNTH